MDLPDCPHRTTGPLGVLVCDSPRVHAPAGIVSARQCQVCRWRPGADRLSSGWERCEHRGEPVRTVECRACEATGTREVPIYSCAIHVECALHAYVPRAERRVAICLGCSSHSPPAP